MGQVKAEVLLGPALTALEYIWKHPTKTFIWNVSHVKNSHSKSKSLSYLKTQKKKKKDKNWGQSWVDLGNYMPKG